MVWEYFKDVVVPVIKERQVHQSQTIGLGDLALELGQASENVSEVYSFVVTECK